MALARAREHQYPFPLFGLVEDAERRRRQVREDCLRHRLETGNYGGSGPSTNDASGSGSGDSVVGNSSAGKSGVGKSGAYY
jgi:hypothetical protein